MVDISSLNCMMGSDWRNSLISRNLISSGESVTKGTTGSSGGGGGGLGDSGMIMIQIIIFESHFDVTYFSHSMKIALSTFSARFMILETLESHKNDYK